MGKKLVAYFSATGNTAKVAEKLAAGIDADLYEIKPEVKYTKADLNWMNKKSRSSVEMNDKSIRPTIVTGDVDVSGYDTIYLGFPIWWNVAPTVINTLLNYEIENAWKKGKGIVGIYIHGLKDVFGEQANKGENPLKDFCIDKTFNYIAKHTSPADGNEINLSKVCKAYDTPYLSKQIVDSFRQK